MQLISGSHSTNWTKYVYKGNSSSSSTEALTHWSQVDVAINLQNKIFNLITQNTL